MDFAQKIMTWYRLHKRDLPWRRTRDPYKIWLSEVILQQTRVDQGLAYYEAFVKKYPDVRALAEAKEEEVLKLWQGLGYYSRARNLHATAKHIVSACNGKFPGNYDELLKLKGVGDYTAAAIASICYNEPKAVVDGNVYRVLSRVFGISTPTDTTKGKKEFRELAASLLSENDPSTFNQAVMEFGAKQCVPKNPGCENCPFLLFCEARRKKRIDKLPVKSKKTNIEDRYFHYFVLRSGNYFFLKQRKSNDIWKNLFDFPLVETRGHLHATKLMQMNESKKITGNKKIKPVRLSPVTKHLLSHRRLHIRFVEIIVPEKFNVPVNWIRVHTKRLDQYAVPVPVRNYLASGNGRIAGERQL